jgi:type IX secretion system PorP/SprF family membrane protein
MDFINNTETNKIKSLLRLLLIFFVLPLLSIHPKLTLCQDAMFSQFYSNPLYLNPALAGTGDCARLMFNYRNQWPSFENNFTTYSASADRYFNGLSGGLGLIVVSDNVGNGIMNTTRLSAIYSVHLRLSSEMNLNAGFEATFHQQKLKFEELIFRDMIDPVTGNINPAATSELPIENSSVSIPDFATGLLLGISETYFIGIAAHHLAQPVLDFYANSKDNLLYRKYTVHAGAKFEIGSSGYNRQDNNFVLSPNILYQYQQAAQQVNFGVYLERSPLVAGVWYRYNVKNSDGAIFLLGLSHKRFKIGYSYDVTLSKLRGTTGGAHEVSMALLVNCNKKRNKPGAIKCPEF